MVEGSLQEFIKIPKEKNFQANSEKIPIIGNKKCQVATNVVGQKGLQGSLCFTLENLSSLTAAIIFPSSKIAAVVLSVSFFRNIISLGLHFHFWEHFLLRKIGD